MRPRVLIVSHNCFSTNTNMGKTLASYFAGWDPSALAQLYLHSELPNTEMCKNYFRITDSNALRSVLRRRRCGRPISPAEILPQTAQTRTDTGTLAKIYQFGRKRTAAIYTARNLMWACSAWRSAALQKWLDDFAPQAVFFASGDYAFAYKIALGIARQRKIPLIVCCMDDYYIHNANRGSLLGRLQHRGFMKCVRRTMDYAHCAVTISEKMTEAYRTLFGKPCRTLHTGTAVCASQIPDDERQGIAYLGNLGYCRHEQLVQLGKALQALQLPQGPHYIDVYSAETNPERLQCLTEENGIRFHGAVSGREVQSIVARSLAVIHTESFREDMRQKVRFSVSTKIADSLASGTCLIAYGPEDVASIEYLAAHGAACVITEPAQLEQSLKTVLTDSAYRQAIIRNAVALAEQNHRGDAVAKFVKQTVEEACHL